jgi:cytochrome c2
MRSFVLIAALCLMPFTDALAQNSEAGQTLAMQVCSRCHAVMRGQSVNPHPSPLPFTKSW